MRSIGIYAFTVPLAGWCLGVLIGGQALGQEPEGQRAGLKGQLMGKPVETRRQVPADFAVLRVSSDLGMRGTPGDDPSWVYVADGDGELWCVLNERDELGDDTPFDAGAPELPTLASWPEVGR